MFARLVAYKLCMQFSRQHALCFLLVALLELSALLLYSPQESYTPSLNLGYHLDRVIIFLTRQMDLGEWDHFPSAR